MIIFIDEERAYLNWVTHHRRAFVMDARHRPKLSHLTLHRASCPEIKARSSRASHWTTKGRLKACASTVEELQQWSAQENQVPAVCDSCRPQESVSDDPGPSTLSKLARDVLDYIVEAALIHFEHEHPPYRLTVGDIAACFGKTPRQLSASLWQLIDHGLISVEQRVRHSEVPNVKTVVFPTLAGLRTQATLAQETDAALCDQLSKL